MKPVWTGFEVRLRKSQIINNELSIIFKNYGTDSLDDLLQMCFGGNVKLASNNEEQLKLDLLKKYLQSSILPTHQV